MSKILDTRLKDLVLDQIVQKFQTGFMTGRFILENVLQLMDIMDITARHKMMSLVMAIEFEKCFDKVNHSAITGSMHYFGIGDGFIDKVMLLFTKFKLCTQSNGYISDWMVPSSGLHQGCCISPHLFLLTGQVFAHLLETNENIHGIRAHNIMLLLSQFADDTNLFLEATSNVINAVTDSLTIAKSNLGLKVNNEKTTLYRIGLLVD